MPSPTLPVRACLSTVSLIRPTSLSSTTHSSLSFGRRWIGELRAPVVLGDRLLPARALHLADREAREAGLEQILADRLERLVPDVGDRPSSCRHLPWWSRLRAAVAVTPTGDCAAGPVEAAPISVRRDELLRVAVHAVLDDVEAGVLLLLGDTRSPIVVLMAANVP